MAAYLVLSSTTRCQCSDDNRCGGPCFSACRPDRDALVKSIHEVVEKADVVKEGWNGYNVIHDNASRVAALDIGFAPRSVTWMAWVRGLCARAARCMKKTEWF